MNDGFVRIYSELYGKATYSEQRTKSIDEKSVEKCNLIASPLHVRRVTK